MRAFTRTIIFSLLVPEVHVQCTGTCSQPIVILQAYKYITSLVKLLIASYKLQPTSTKQAYKLKII